MQKPATMPNQSGRRHNPNELHGIYDPYHRAEDREPRRDDDYRGYRSEDRWDRDRDDWRAEEWRRDWTDRERPIHRSSPDRMDRLDRSDRGTGERYGANRRYDEARAEPEPERTHYGDRYPPQWSPASQHDLRRVHGPHHGKGPSGFKRSDERVREMVCEALTDDDHVDASNIEVSVKAGEVTLTGTIDDRRMKRLAEDCVERVAGVRDVLNQLRVGSERNDRHSTRSDSGRNDS